MNDHERSRIDSVTLSVINNAYVNALMTTSSVVQKLWNYCSILRDDGLSYGDYVEQLTFRLFLKMADEQAKPPFNKTSSIPKGKDWPALLAKDGDQYRDEP